MDVAQHANEGPLDTDIQDELDLSLDVPIISDFACNINLIDLNRSIEDEIASELLADLACLQQCTETESPSDNSVLTVVPSEFMMKDELIITEDNDDEMYFADEEETAAELEVQTTFNEHGAPSPIDLQTSVSENVEAAEKPASEFDLEFSTALSDHNYSSARDHGALPNREILRQLLVNHLRLKKTDHQLPASTQINSFVDNILYRINDFTNDDDHQQSNFSDNESEVLAQNFEDSVAEENAKNVEEFSIISLKDIESAAPIKSQADAAKETSDKISEKQRLMLDKLSNFGKSLQDKCKMLAENAKQNFDEQLKLFVKSQLNQLKQLTGKRGKLCQEDSVQTDESKALLNSRSMQAIYSSTSSDSSESDSSSSSSSNSSSSSCTSSSSSSCPSDCSKNSRGRESHKSASLRVKEERRKCEKIASKIKSKFDVEKKDKNLEINSVKKHKTLGDAGSDKENSKKANASKDEDDEMDEEDKEIERLVNFDGLLKRSKYIAAGSTGKTAEIGKQKTKLKDLLLKDDNSDDDEDEDEELSDDDDDDEVMAKQAETAKECNGEEQEQRVDASTDAEGEEVISEKEYLKRYNESLKQHFLNDSSSMSEESGESENELIKDLHSDTDDEKSLSLVDKFLQNYIVDESEEVDGDEEEIEEKSVADEPTDADKEQKTKIDEKPNHAKSDDELNSLEKSEKQAIKEDSALKEKDEIKTTDSAISNSDCELLNENSIFSQVKQPKKPKKSLEVLLSEADKRKKTNKIDSSDLISLSSDSSSSSDVEAADGETATTDQHSRVIKPMLRQDQLASETRRAQKMEADRIRRLEKKHANMAKLLKDVTTTNNKQNELILDYNSETKTFIKVHPDIVKHLKSHQIDGIKFMYDSCYGGVDAMKKSAGSGCILAHCMGLGKTLQLIALLHTVISYKELKTAKVLVLCPKSTVMNWADEILRWLGPLNAKNLKVYTFNETS